MRSDDPPVLHISGRVVLGDGRETEDVWVDRGVLTLVRPTGLYSQMLRIDGVAVPGLVDVHSHIGLVSTGAADQTTTQAQAVKERQAGVLAIRDAGSPADTRWIDERADLPRVVRAGRHIARPKRYLRGYAEELTDPDELPEAMARQARRGDGWVKIVGDWIDRSLGADGDLRPLWTREQLIAGVRAAHREGARVTVHTFAAETIDDLLAAGVDGIEHGTGISPDQAKEIAARGIPVAPTLLQIAKLADVASAGEAKYPRFAERMRRLAQQRYEQVRMLYEAGVSLVVGTDAGGTIGHGRIADECAELVRAGIPAPEVVADASWRARRLMGFFELTEGASADLVVYPSDPREDITTLARPRAVILRGRVVD